MISGRSASTPPIVRRSRSGALGLGARVVGGGAHLAPPRQERRPPTMTTSTIRRALDDLAVVGVDAPEDQDRDDERER